MAYMFGNSGSLWINSANQALLNIRTGSISAWVFTNTFGGSDGGSNGRIYNTGFAPGAGQSSGLLDFSLNNTVTATDVFFQFVSSSGAVGAQRESTGQILQKVWTHVGVSYNAVTDATQIKIYVGGTEGAYAVTTNGASIGSDSGNHIFIGSTKNFNRATSGGIMCLAVWNTQLNTQEWQMLARSRFNQMPLQIQPSHLVFFAPLDGSSEGVSAVLNGATDVAITSAGNIVIQGTNSAVGALPKGMAGALTYP